MRGQILDFSIDFRRRPYNTLMLLFRVSIIIWIQDKTEYQLLRKKASDGGQSVNLSLLIGCVLTNYYNNS